MYLHYCSKSPEKRQQKIHRMQFLQHRQANESFLLPSVRCRGKAFRMGMGSPPIPLSLSRETVGGCALPRLFGVIIGPGACHAGSRCGFIPPMEAHGSWRQLPLGRRKRAVCPRSLLAVKQAVSLDAWFPCLPWGRVQGLLPADSRLAPPKPVPVGRNSLRQRKRG